MSRARYRFRLAQGERATNYTNREGARLPQLSPLKRQKAPSPGFEPGLPEGGLGGGIRTLIFWVYIQTRYHFATPRRACYQLH